MGFSICVIIYLAILFLFFNDLSLSYACAIEIFRYLLLIDLGIHPRFACWLCHAIIEDAMKAIAIAFHFLLSLVLNVIDYF